MEHRREYRLPIPMLINIQSNQDSLGYFNIQNISIGGVCVNDINNHLSKGDFVNLDLKIGNINQPTRYYMKAIVVYRENNNVGLMWADYEPKFLNFLQDLASIAA